MVGLLLQCAFGDDADALVTATRPAPPSARAAATPTRTACRTGRCVNRIRMITPCLYLGGHQSRVRDRIPVVHPDFAAAWTSPPHGKKSNEIQRNMSHSAPGMRKCPPARPAATISGPRSSVRTRQHCCHIVRTSLTPPRRDLTLASGCADGGPAQVRSASAMAGSPAAIEAHPRPAAHSAVTAES